MKKIFVDNLTGGSVRQGVVRLEFSEVESDLSNREQGAEGEAGAFRYQSVHRLYMPLTGFLQAFQMMQKIKDGLEEKAKNAQNEGTKDII